MNYYRRYLGDYMSKTMHLSIMEHGVYTLLLDACYATEKPLPTDYDSLYRVCRAMTKIEKDAVRRVVDAFFPIQSDGLRHNERADQEIATAQQTIEKQRESAVNRHSKSRSSGSPTCSSTTTPSTSQTRQPSTPNLQPSGNKNSSNKFVDEDLELAKHIFSLILTLHPKHREPIFETWANEIRLMRERDSRSLSEIRELFEWANQDSFWKLNILSPVKLREQWDKLVIKRANKGQPSSTGRKTFADYQSKEATNDRPSAIPGTATRLD